MTDVCGTDMYSTGRRYLMEMNQTSTKTRSTQRAQTSAERQHNRTAE